MFGLRRRVRIAYEPIPWSAQGDQKSEEKKQPISEPLFLATNYKNIQKRDPKGLQKVPKCSSLFWGFCPLGHLWSPKLIFDSKSEPTAPPKVPQGPEKGSKMNPRHPKVTPRTEKYSNNDPQSAPERGLLNCTADLHIWPGGLREAL